MMEPSFFGALWLICVGFCVGLGWSIAAWLWSKIAK